MSNENPGNENTTRPSQPEPQPILQLVAPPCIVFPLVPPPPAKPRIPDPAAWRWLSLLIDHSPCFLLSGVLMFLGCYLLNSAMDVRAADIEKSLLLLATINVYEAALITLGLALFPKPAGRGRDGILLLTIQLLFLTDGPFLIAQLVQATPAWGWLIALALAALAIFKATVVMNVLRIPIRARTLAFLILQLLLIYGLPVVLSQTAIAGEHTAKTFYAIWWIVGLLPALYDLVANLEPLAPLTPRQQFLRRSYLIIPWLLLVAHISFLHWVYRADFVPADLSPVLLGLAMATRRITPNALLPKNQIRFVRLALPAVAILLALAGSDMPLAVPLTSITLPPALLTTAAAMILYGYLHSLPAAACAIAATFLMALGRLFLTDILSILRTTTNAAATSTDYLLHLAPTTATAWGILAIIAAFLLLALGALYSLRPERSHETST